MNKIESGKMELTEEDFNLAELIDRLLTMTQPQIQAHEHTFRVNIVNVHTGRLPQFFLCNDVGCGSCVCCR